MRLTAPIRLLLGPQRPVRNLGEAVARAELPDGPVAVISAGWQEAEGDIDDIREVIGRPLEDLRLYHRAEDVFARDPGLAEAYRARQDRLREQQRLYRLRLRQLAIAAEHTLQAEGDADTVAAEQRHAIAQLRALDRHHLTRTEVIHAEFSGQYDAVAHGLLAEHAQAIEEQIGAASAVLITGGNVVVLHNRMRLFDVPRMLGTAHVIAWSAGSMALAGRIVLFHDRAPEGPREPEVLGAGGGLLRKHVILPDTNRRLLKGDCLRMSLMSRRFSPDTSVVLDSGAELLFANERPVQGKGAKRLNRNGRVVGIATK